MAKTTMTAHKILSSTTVRMMLVGGISLISAYAVFLLLLTLGVHYQIASVANFSTYWVVNFILNKTWAFKSTGDAKKEAAAHFSLHLGNQLLIMAGLYVMVEHIGIFAAWAQIIMQIVATITVLLLTPLIFKTR